jgi:zinc protease
MNARILKTLLLILVLLFLTGPLLAMPKVQRMVLPNQLVLLVNEDHSLPFVTLQLLIDSGSRRDPPGKEGLANLTAKGLLFGTLKRTVASIHEELDFMGASLNASAGRDYATVMLKILKKDLNQGLDLFTDVLTQPTFPEDEIKRELEKTLAAIQSAEEQPDVVAEKAFQRALFLTGSYSHPVEGTKESVPQLTREAVAHFFQAYYHPNNAVLTVVGDITVEELKTRLFPALEKWPAAKISEEAFKVTFEKERKTIKVDREITQANMILGHRGVSRSNPDYYALMVMNYILGGGGFTSRLVDEIRVKRGLAYAVDSFFDAARYPGSFQIALQTKNSTAREAIALSLQQMERIRKEMVSEKELEGAKKYLIGSFPMRFDTQAKMANFLTQVEYYGLGLDYPEKYPSLIRAVTREDVLRVAQTYLQPESIILVIVGGLKEAGME